MCSHSRFNTRPSWLDVLSPEGLEWLWKSVLIQPSVFTERISFAARTDSLPLPRRAVRIQRRIPVRS